MIFFKFSGSKECISEPKDVTNVIREALQKAKNAIIKTIDNKCTKDDDLKKRDKL